MSLWLNHTSKKPERTITYAHTTTSIVTTRYKCTLKTVGSQLSEHFIQLTHNEAH